MDSQYTVILSAFVDFYTLDQNKIKKKNSEISGIKEIVPKVQMNRMKSKNQKKIKVRKNMSALKVLPPSSTVNVQGEYCNGKDMEMWTWMIPFLKVSSNQDEDADG